MFDRTKKIVPHSIFISFISLFLTNNFNYQLIKKSRTLEDNQELVGVIKKILDNNHVVFSFEKTIVLPEETVKSLQNYVGRQVSVIRIEDSYFINYDEKNKNIIGGKK